MQSFKQDIEIKSMEDKQLQIECKQKCYITIEQILKDKNILGC